MRSAIELTAGLDTRWCPFSDTKSRLRTLAVRDSLNSQDDALAVNLLSEEQFESNMLNDLGSHYANS